MRALSRRKTTVYTVTDASRPLSEDVDERQRHYLISMGIRMVCFLLAVALWGRIHPVLLGILLVGAILLPYTSVIFANGGRLPPEGADLTDPSELRALPPSPPPPGRSTTGSGENGSGVPPETSP
ncbi:DUF3099 domain-containing protein [Actinocorallia sp. B10E7]|uniref:DUF3099 domain-containing protein n=1 Tax=Actinocorallia sp. B10E7 TaxID=3153558 RepID=UPI00325D645E